MGNDRWNTKYFYVCPVGEPRDSEAIFRGSFTGPESKFAEGLAESMVQLIKDQVQSHAIAKIGGLMLRGALRDVHRKMDYAEYGGAPLLGVNGICIISHGKSNPKAIRNAIRVAANLVEKKTNEHICQQLERIQDPSSVSI
jgi:glycerol-3-phosphate acyltransferase PlsX